MTERKRIKISEKQPAGGTLVNRPRRGLQGLMEYFGGLIMGFPRKLDREADELTEQFSAIQRGEITNPEEINKIRQRSRDWRKRVVDFWLD